MTDDERVKLDRAVKATQRFNADLADLGNAMRIAAETAKSLETALEAAFASVRDAEAVIGEPGVYVQDVSAERMTGDSVVVEHIAPAEGDTL